MKQSSTKKRKSIASTVDGDVESEVQVGAIKKEKTMLKTDETLRPLKLPQHIDDFSYNSDLVPERNERGDLVFLDHPEFRPNLTPEQVIRQGSFGGTYFRPIDSAVAKRSFTSEEAMAGLPSSWFKGLNIDSMVTSSTYNTKVNKYKAKCGQGLIEWESSGWITPYDPYGWFQWYCHFYLGRRCPDDERQIRRGNGVMGERGRWRSFLAKKCLDSDQRLKDALNDYKISPKVRQLLQHWGYAMTLDALKYAKKMR